MARINSNIPALIARANLARSNENLALRLERLATGIRLNRGADDPAGLIISERIRSDLRGVEQGIKNAERASSVIATTEASLSEVSELLNSIKALVVQAANTGAFSEEEIAANQQQIDSAIDSITRISNTATFGGLKLLDGSLDYTLSGLSTSAIAQAQVLGASFLSASELQVDVEVLGSAQTGALFLRGDYSDPSGNGTILSSMTLRIAGAEGVTELQIASQQSLAQVVTAVNNFTSLTGVTAKLINPSDMSSGLVFESEGYGGNSMVSVERLNAPPDNIDSFETYKLTDNEAVPSFPPFPWAAYIGDGRLSTGETDDGKDVNAIVNGVLATGDGLELKVRSTTLSMDLLLTEANATMPSTSLYDSTSTFHITGGGALFQLGPEINANQQANLGVQSIAASRLGGTLIDGAIAYLNSLKSGQANSLKSSKDRGDFSQASDVLDSAIDEVSILRGRLGAFERNVLQTNVRALQSAFENLTASQSQIRDADFALETSELTRAQILVSASTSVLALANQQSQSVLQLLG